MKKIFLTMACLSTLFAACTDTEVVESGFSSDVISFGTYIGQNTRAIATTTANFTEFGVSAYYSKSAVWETGNTSASSNYLNKDKVTGSSGTGWTYNNPKYWPVSGYVNFWAWSPAESKSMTWTEGSGVPSFTYTVEDAVANQEDLVVALTIDQQKSADNVSLTFNHLLSKIGFSAKLADTYSSATVKVTTMEVSYAENKVKNKGVYTYDGTTTWASAEGDSYQTAATNSLLSSATGALNNNSSTALNDDDKFLMLLPQEVVKGALSAKITYTVTYADGVETTNVEAIELPVQEWVAGKQYTYNFTISLTGVTFDVTAVTPWSDAPTVMINNQPAAEFAQTSIALASAANSTVRYTTSGIRSIKAENTDDFSVSYAKNENKAISDVTGNLTFTAKKKNETGETKTANMVVAITDISGNESEVTFTLVQAPEIGIFKGGVSILGNDQTLVYNSIKDLYSVNGTQASSVTYTIVGVTDVSNQVTITNNNTTDFTVTATTTTSATPVTTLTITPKTELSDAGNSNKDATVTVALKDKDGNKVGDYSFTLKQYAKAYVSTEENSNNYIHNTTIKWKRILAAAKGTKKFKTNNGTSQWADNAGDPKAFSYTEINGDVDTGKMAGTIKGTEITITSTHRLTDWAYATVTRKIVSTNAIGETSDEEFEFYIYGKLFD